MYLSNENSEAVDIHWDDFTVYHGKTNVVSTQDYYPFGLTFNESVRVASTPNTMNTFQDQEYDEETGWVQFKWRNHMPEIGRFFNVDPLSHEYVYNSPYAFSENAVVAHIELEGLEKVSYMAKTQRTQSGKSEYSGGVVNLQTAEITNVTEYDSDLSFHNIGTFWTPDAEASKEDNTTTVSGGLEFVNGADFEISMTPSYDFENEDGEKFGTINITAKMDGVKDEPYFNQGKKEVGQEIGTITIGGNEIILSIDGNESDSGEVNIQLFFRESNSEDPVQIISSDTYQRTKDELNNE